MKTRKKIALVLGGGGALGCAHIGVIKVLKKYNIPIDIVVGTSMGGVVGAAYAVGLDIDQMTSFATKFKTTDFLDVNFDASGLFSGKGVMNNIHKFIPDVNIESLDTVFACVASDLMSEKEYVFQTGSLREAVRATLSIPGIFVPVKKDDMLLVDGGILNNLPEEVAVKLGADIIISSDVLANFKLTQAPKNAIETLVYSINLSTKEMQKYKAYHADVLLRPDMTGLGQMIFTKKKTELAIARGEEETEEHIQEIIEKINE